MATKITKSELKQMIREALREELQLNRQKQNKLKESISTTDPWLVLERDPVSQFVHIVTDNENEARYTYEVALFNFKARHPDDDEAVLLVQFFDVSTSERARLDSLVEKEITGADDAFVQDFIENDRYDTAEYYEYKEGDSDFEPAEVDYNY